MVSAAVTVVAHAASLTAAGGRTRPRVSAVVTGVAHPARSEAAGSGRSPRISALGTEVAHAASLGLREARPVQGSLLPARR
ncbi:hypothetical protein PF003_g36654 [Phytophthora fragariae]|nr:hypothetical protein PF003_g36654 [Phytophthora fragariae]